ncbi:MAG: glucose 1-dehydrogenase [Acidobacteria bacterium]|nr:glucose 1-dehydrogenase [Acidobacteriota bacterium]
MYSLQDKVAIVTGSGRGIGRATVLKLASLGAKVIINDVDEEPAKEVEEAVRSAGGQAVVVLGSVARSEDANAVVQAALAHYGQLDILVNNAGLTRDAMIHRMTDGEYDLVMNVVLRGTFNCTRAAVAHFRNAAKQDQEQGRRIHRKIVNVTSIAGIHGSVGNANYAAAKAGVIGLTKTAARELGPFLVNVNAVAPGFIDTRLTAGRGENAPPGFGIPPEIRQRIVQQMPFGRIGQPEDVATAIAFLASPEADFITGQVLQVHGGLEFINVTG